MVYLSMATAKEMDNIFEHSSSGTSGPSGMPDEVAEAEGLLTNPGHTTTNKWGPILYNRDHHPLHIMVHIAWVTITTGIDNI